MCTRERERERERGGGGGGRAARERKEAGQIQPELMQDGEVNGDYIMKCF